MSLQPSAFGYQLDTQTSVATITLNRPERLNALTFEVYTQLRDTFRALDTEMTKESVERVVAKTGKAADAALSAMLASASQRRLITPDEVAQTVLTLCDINSKRPNGTAVTIAG